MKAVCKCGSYAINHHCHGRDGSDGDLCDVCYWRKRAEQPAQQEPVAWEYCEEIYAESNPELNDYIRANGIPLYTSPPAQRKPLTDEEIHAIYDEVARQEPYMGAVTRRSIARAIEAAHGIKENT